MDIPLLVEHHHSMKNIYVKQKSFCLYVEDSTVKRNERK